jgi:hypothetical protein
LSSLVFCSVFAAISVNSKYVAKDSSPSRKASAWTGRNEKGRELPRSRP